MASKHLQPELRIVLLGKTGSGKSTAGNMILGKKNCFKTGFSPASVTERCEMETGKYREQTLVVVDTPGLFHTTLSDKDLMKRLLECTMWTKPGPHVLLLVLKADPFTTGDKEILETFQKVFKDAKRHTILLFTHGYEKGSNSFLEKFIDESCGAYHVFEKKNVCDKRDERKVRGLLDKINSMVQENDPPYYSIGMFGKAEAAYSEAFEEKSGSKEMALMYLESLISEGTAALEVYQEIKTFLDMLNKIARRLMPPPATK